MFALIALELLVVGLFHDRIVLPLSYFRHWNDAGLPVQVHTEKEQFILLATHYCCCKVSAHARRTIRAVNAHTCRSMPRC